MWLNFYNNKCYFSAEKNYEADIQQLNERLLDDIDIVKIGKTEEFIQKIYGEILQRVERIIDEITKDDISQKKNINDSLDNLLKFLQKLEKKNLSLELKKKCEDFILKVSILELTIIKQALGTIKHEIETARTQYEREAAQKSQQALTDKTIEIEKISKQINATQEKRIDDEVPIRSIRVSKRSP